MKEDHYLIKEAANLVGVETHVLRYWEEELKMEIHRNDLGHRYYTQKDVENLKRVKELKDRGLQLKAIRNYLEMRKEQISKEQQKKLSVENKKSGSEDEESLSKEEKDSVSNRKREQEEHAAKGTEQKSIVPVKELHVSNEEKMIQFQKLMNKIVAEAIEENNELIGKSAGTYAAQAMAGQVMELSKDQERQAEERFQKLDRTLREIQQARLEAAAANMRPVDKRRQARLKRNGKNKQQKMQSQIVENQKEQDETA